MAFGRIGNGFTATARIGGGSSRLYGSRGKENHNHKVRHGKVFIIIGGNQK